MNEHSTESGLSILEPDAAVAEPAAPKKRRQRKERKPGRSRLHLIDLLDEAVLSLGSRPARMVLTMVGTIVGIASLVATLGLGATAAGQIAQRFDAAAATRIVVEPGRSAPTGPEDADADPTLPWSAAERVSRLAGVIAAGSWTELELPDGVLVTGVAIVDPTKAEELPMTVAAASAGTLEANEGTMLTGRFLDQGHSDRADRVAVLGREVAEKLGINRVDSRPSIFIGNLPYAVIGIIDSSPRRPALQSAVIIPDGTAERDFELAGPTAVDVRTDLGAAQQVAGQAAVAVSPNDPTLASVKAPPKPGDLGSSVNADVNGLFLAFGALGLLVGGFGIANVTLLSVMERTGEIGLRRALGARRWHIAAQFLTESGTLGLLGGIVGAAIGVPIVAVVSALQDWSPILDYRLVLLAPILGMLIGLLSGAYPSIKAAAIEPITALRQS